MCGGRADPVVQAPGSGRLRDRQDDVSSAEAEALCFYFVSFILIACFDQYFADDFLFAVKCVHLFFKINSAFIYTSFYPRCSNSCFLSARQHYCTVYSVRSTVYITV